MQTPKSRPGSLEFPHKKSSLPDPKIGRKLKPTGTDPKSKIIPKNQFAKVVIDRGSLKIPLNEIQKKRTGRIPELESQVSQLQEELKKTKEELNRSEVLKRKAQEEAKKTRQLLMEINASEDSRIDELRKLSQKRDMTWQSELEAMQRQHGMDLSALSSAINEVQKLKSKLFGSESELEQSKSEVRSLEIVVKQLEEERENSRDSSSALMEVEDLKEAMNLARNEINELKSAVEVAEIKYKEEYEQTEAVKSRYIQREAGLMEELKRSKAEIEVLSKSELMEKEMELQGLRSEMEKTMEVANTEAMEAELRRVKIQCGQWRKAAETAASILNDDEERTNSIENGKILKKIGVLLKKNHK